MHKWLRTSKRGNVRVQKGARAGLSGTHTQWMEARTGTHTHTHPGLAHTHTHTPSPWTEARTGTHTHTQSWKNSQDWHTHPGLAFAAGVYKWLRTSEKGNALQKGAGAANGLQICCGHAKWLRASLPKQAEGKGSRKNTYSALLKLRVESVKGRQNLKGYGMLREAAAKSSGKGCGFE